MGHDEREGPAGDGAVARRACEDVIDALLASYVVFAGLKSGEGPWLLAVVLFEEAKRRYCGENTIRSVGFNRDELDDAIETLAKERFDERGHSSIGDINKNLTRMSDRIAQFSAAEEASVVDRIAGPTKHGRGDNRSRLWLDIRFRRETRRPPRVDETAASPARTKSSASLTGAGAKHPAALPPLGQPIILLHIVREREVDVADDEPALFNLTPEQIVECEAHEYALSSQHTASMELSGGVEIVHERFHVEKIGANLYRGVVFAELRLPSWIGVAELPSLLALQAAAIPTKHVELRFTPADPVAVWFAALDALRDTDPQPIWSGDDFPTEWMYGRDDIHCTKVKGAGPGTSRYTAFLQPDAIVVMLYTDGAKAMAESMRGCALRTFLRERIGLNADR